VDTYYLLYDEPDLFSEVLLEMQGDRMRMLSALLPHTRADTFWISENTSTSLLSPEIFEKYCAPHLADYGRLILEIGTAVPVHHMCGTLNALLEQIDELPSPVNEAYTTRPLGDVSLAEGRNRMPGKALWGGTNATLWLEDPETIAETVGEDISECPDRRKIFLTSAGVLPPLVSFEKARDTVALLKSL
jgi:uroporphyrinogen-III decarboxylase